MYFGPGVEQHLIMQNDTNHLRRRSLVRVAWATVARSVFNVGKAEEESPTTVSLFDEKTLNGISSCA